MIVRIVTAHVPSGSTSAVHQHIREQWLPALQAQPGMVYSKLARRLDDGGERLLLISEWHTVSDLYRWAGDGFDGRQLFEGDSSLFDSWTVEHYESLDRLPDDPLEDDLDGNTAA